jgi:hypothetical protein
MGNWWEQGEYIRINWELNENKKDFDELLMGTRGT